MELKQRSSRYILYAMGEIFLVVVGILIALQINNWNEWRKQENVRLDLIENLKVDFESTLVDLNETLEIAETQTESFNTLFEAMVGSRQYMPVDEIKELIRVIFSRGLYFDPYLSSYHSAHSTGTINLIGSRKLSELFIEFEQYHRIYSDYDKINREQVFSGFRHDLRKELGSQRGVLYGDYANGSKYFELTEPEFRAFLKRKDIHGTFESLDAIKRNQSSRLIGLKETTKAILKELESL